MRLRRPQALTTAQRRRVGLFAGLAGIASILGVGLPLWTLSAKAAPSVTFEPSTGDEGTQVAFSIGGCAEVGDVDVAIEIDTSAGTVADVQLFALDAEGEYVYTAPAEFDYFFVDPEAGPTYQVNVTCFDSITAMPTTVDAGDFTYLRGAATTTSTTAESTTTTEPGSTTTTTEGGTTTTTEPGSTTTTTAGGTTTTTEPGSTTTTTAGATTTTTAPAGTTTTTAGATTTTTAPATTTSTTAGATTTTTAPAATTTTTAAAATTTSSSTSTSTSTTIPPVTAAVSDTTPERGQLVTVTGSGFLGSSNVIVELLSTPVRLGTLKANAQGAVSGEVRIPLGTELGAHDIKLTGSNAAGAAVERSVPITVVASTALPATGAESHTTLRIALLLIGFGLLAIGRGQLLAARL